MAAIDIPKLEELCRLCAAKTTLVLAINIFENEGTIRQIGKKISACLPIQIHEQDELPKMICENCLYKLELFSDFRDRTVRTERLLVELYKQLKSQVQSEGQCVVAMGHNELIMVQHHELLHQNLQNVSEIDLSQLGHREGMIVEHGIILTHHNVDMNSHSLDSIELNNDLASRELSNQSLQTQESIMVDSNPDARFTEENLSLMQHHLLNDQFRLQHELHVTIANENAVNDFRLPEEIKHGHPHSNQRYPQDKNIDYVQKIEENSLTVDSGLSDNTLSMDSQLNDIKLHIYTQENNHVEHLRHEDSSSDNTILVEGQMNAVIDKQGYLLQSDSASSEHLTQLNYCTLCGKMFEQKDDFENHYEEHIHKCQLCEAVFTTPDELMLHKEDVHNSCNVKSETPSENVSREPPLNELEEVFSEESDVDGDLDGVTDGDPLRLKQTAIKVETQPEDNVIDSDNKKKKWSPKFCKECGKQYKTNYKLQEHMRKHTGEKPYKCRSCEKAFRSKIGLAQHEAKHTGHYDYSCPTCGKGFQCKSYLMVHQRVHSDVKPYPCTTCGQNFKTKQSLLDHTNRHLGVKPYMCDICGRGFITKGLCRAHQKIHSGQDNRKYSCKICNKMFVSKSYLQTHLRIHTGEKPFMCEVCGKGFLTRVDLKIHSTMHTGEKSYVCEMCGKAFARRDALRCHRRSHTGERPYSCDLCGQTFTQFTPMAIHKRLHTGERPYACETCGKTFVSRSTMMSHAKKHSKNEKPKFESLENIV